MMFSMPRNLSILALRVLFAGLILFELLAWAELIPVPPPDFTWLGLVGTAIAVWIFVELARLPGWLRFVVWASTLADALIDSFHIYSRWHPSDRIMHFANGFIVAAVTLYLVNRWMREKNVEFPRRALFVGLFAIFTACFVSVVYEGWEFFIDLTYLKASKALGDGRDTVDDELLALLGGTIAVIGHWVLSKNPEH